MFIGRYMNASNKTEIDAGVITETCVQPLTSTLHIMLDLLTINFKRHRRRKSLPLPVSFLLIFLLNLFLPSPLLRLLLKPSLPRHDLG